MRWTVKARIQRLVAALPPGVGDPLYFAIQRRAGFFRDPDPFPHLEAARDLALAAERNGRPVAGSRILEIGTGHRLLLPIAFHLMGAESVTTVDVRRHLRPELVLRDLEGMLADGDRAGELLAPGDGSGIRDRLDRLRDTISRSASRFLDELRCEYRAPADSGRLDDPDDAFDLHVSRSVMEHVPPVELDRIFREGVRVVRASGALLHLIDFSDHFAHADPSLSTINFLRFPEERWRRWSGNRFAYHNRWRSEDFEELFARIPLRIAERELVTDPAARALLAAGFPLDEAYRGRDPDRLAHRQGTFVLVRPER